MKARPSRGMPITASVCLLSLTTAFVLFAALAPRADAAFYKMVSCSANNGTAPYATATNTTSPQNPGGIFDFNNWCGGAGGDPPGEAAYLRINEHESAGNAGNGAYGDMIFDTPPYVHFRSAGGYTREPNAFNDGWRARFWMLDFANNGWQLLSQGAGVPNSGTQSPISGTFGPHLWPLGTELDFWRFVFELECVRPAGCDRSNYNATDANGFVFILSDDSNSQVGFTGGQLLTGQWVRGAQEVDWNSSDQGSGLRFERLRTDGAVRYTIDYQAAGQCNTTWTQTNGEWARTYQPCPTGGPWGRAYSLDTTSLADGVHSLSVCTQDFGQYQGLDGTGGESCDQRTIRTDNTAPGAPAGLEVTSANAARYLPQVGAHWQLPPNQGSPIARVHYNIVDAAGDVVTPEQTVSGSNLSALPKIEGPSKAGDYRLRLWLEDEVGFEGPVATTPIPHDTTPPAAPQEVSVTPPTTSRAAQGFDLRWRNVLDAGSPIAAVHYQLLNASGGVAVPAQTIAGDDVQAIQNLETPSQRGSYTLRIWLSDAEGNVGAPTTAPLAYECMRSDVSGGTALTSGLGEHGVVEETVKQGAGATLRGKLAGAGGGVGEASLCVFSRVLTDQPREFLGVAVSGPDGNYQFAIPAGPSRDLSVLYRSGSREVSSHATTQTIVRPSFAARKKVIHNKHWARFYGEIPGPDNDRVVVVLQAKVGKGKWLAFRRYRTRDGGRFSLRYRFHRTTRPTTYVMRAQVRAQGGYPYLQGNSRLLSLRVLP